MQAGEGLGEARKEEERRQLAKPKKVADGFEYKVSPLSLHCLPSTSLRSHFDFPLSLLLRFSANIQAIGQVKGLASERHQLTSLLNTAFTQRDELEDRISSNKKNARMAKSKYGF